MTTPVNRVDEVGPLSHAAAMTMQAVELETTLRLLRSLTGPEWSVRVPACPLWDVREMYLHVLGACEGAAFGQMARQMTAAMRRRRMEGGPLEANLSAVQIAGRSHLTPDELLTRLAEVAPRTVRQRRRMPGVLRKGFAMKVDGPIEERWKLGYLIDTIYLRDLWMHRLDACDALGRTPDLTAEHDGSIVADVVAEWARRHGRAFTLELAGVAGGRFTAGEHGESLAMDAVSFCRVLSGRKASDVVGSDGLLSTIVPF